MGDIRTGDWIIFHDPLLKAKVKARVYANLGPDSAGNKDDRIYVENPGGSTMVWPSMKPEIVDRAEKFCPTCKRPYENNR